MAVWFYSFFACCVLYRMSGWVHWKAHATLLCQVCACRKLLTILNTVTENDENVGYLAARNIEAYVCGSGLG